MAADDNAFNGRKKKLTVFISSTYVNSVERRKLVEDAVLRAQMLPIGMERFTASAESTVSECERMAANCDVFVGIIAHRYGWIPDGKTVSITELEYSAAKSAKRPRLMFELSSNVDVNVERDFDPLPDRWRKQELLAAFKRNYALDQMPAQFAEQNLSMLVLQALNDWRRTHEPAVWQATSADAALASDLGELNDYARVAQDVHGFIQLAGFVTRLRVELDLEGLYVPLRGFVDLRGDGDAVFADAVEAEGRLAEHKHEITLHEAFREAEQRKRRALVVLGDPGSGKTTLLKRLLLYCLRRDATELGLPPHAVPVFLPLRELGACRDLATFIERQLTRLVPELPQGIGNRLLANAPLLLLFDGLDEVADATERDDVATWIEGLATTKPTCRIVVTCRFAGYSGNARLGVKFLELHVRPLLPDQAEMFVRNWFRLVETQLASGNAEARQKQAETRAESLLARLREPDQRSARLVEMVRNPLLLANVCLVFRVRGELPRGRERLYGECIDVLLEHWRQEKRLSVGVRSEAGRRALQPVALWMHEHERRRATSAELEAVLGPALRAVQHRLGSAREFLHSVRDQTGLLTGWSSDEFGFMHLGFQEYLAALELRRLAVAGDTHVLDLVATHYGQSWWHEVILVLFSLGEPAAFELFMPRIVTQQAFAEQSELIELLFEDAAKTSPEPFETLLRQSDSERLGPMQLTAARILARYFPSQLESLRDVLRAHPDREVSAWAEAQFQSTERAKRDSEFTVDGLGTKLILIQGGTFVMGSPESESGRYIDEGPTREVTVSSFYLGRYPITNEEYGAFLKAHPDAQEPAFWADRRYNQAHQPVVGVSWNQAAAFAQWAGCRLPTEAEWEYACRAGTEGSRYGELDQIAWYDANSKEQLHPVGMKQPNVWGLHDMLGNVYEYCSDWLRAYDASAMTEPTRARVVRGGSWDERAEHARAALRGGADPDTRNRFLGIRLARSPSPASM